MKIDPKQIGLWVGLPAVLLVGILKFGAEWDGFQASQTLLAQEAARETAEVVVEEKMGPAVKELEAIKESLRRQEDRDLIDRCELKGARRGEDPVDYEIRCEAESDLRWEWWEFDDCMDQGRHDCVEPRKPRP